jgi:hypothetical protein
MFLEALEHWTEEHRLEFERRGVEVVLSEPSQPPKPSRWINLRSSERELEVGV